MQISPNVIFKGPFTIRTYEIDRRKKVTAPGLIQLMQEAAMQNVINLNLSVWDLEDQQISWVLMRKQLDIFRLPILGETIEIETHPAGFERVFTYRDYKVYDTKGALLAQASSTWLLMDTIKRKMAPIPKYLFDYNLPDPASCLPKPRFKLPKLEQTDVKKQYEVNWYDLDFNGHLGNVKYVRWMLETMPDQVLENAELEQLQIAYKMESHWKDKVISETQKLAENHYLHRLIREKDQRELATASSFWKKMV